MDKEIKFIYRKLLIDGYTAERLIPYCGDWNYPWSEELNLPKIRKILERHV